MNILQFPSTIEKIAIYNYSYGARELPVAMLSAIFSVYNKPWNVEIVNHLQKDRIDLLYIIICPAALPCDINSLPIYYIGWQLEDVQGNNNNINYLTILRKALYVWDYSPFNVKLLKERDNIDAIYCPVGFDDTISTPDILNGQYIYSDNNKDIDVLFLGYCDAYPRRVKMRDDFYKFCVENGYKMLFVSTLDIKGMKEVIRRAKVCINLASKEPSVLATIRLNILLSNQTCIVSEYSCDKETDLLYSESGIFLVNYDNMISLTKKLLSIPEIRRRSAIKSYKWYSKRQWPLIFDFNKYLPVTN